MSLKVDYIWRDGEIVPWDQGDVHLMTHSLHYGLAAFEGIRCYAQTDGGAGIFRLVEHLDRLYNTAHICLMQIPFKREQLVEGCRELVKKNGLMEGCYLRPLVYMGEGAMGIAADNPIHVAILAWKWGAYLGEDGVKKGIRAKISSYRRARGDAMLAKGKITGHYVTSILAKREAMRGGYNEAILLDANGQISEGSGENIFVVSRGRVKTPPLGAAILEGITRESVMQLLAEEGLPVEATAISREELYCADEVFLTGTAAEVTPVREVDDRKVGEGTPGPITRRVQERYGKLVRGAVELHKDWITRV